MRKLITLVILLALPTLTWADSSNLIASYCKKQWRGNKVMQSFCIKEKRNYRDWLKYIRKRVYSNPYQLAKVDQCIHNFEPDFRRAIDCYWSKSSSDDFPETQ
ncbi:MAG: hypothetical protein OQK12_15400 [Motiliproteus sp.]|nr:hypothetical protein [Motiliproteus sp.]MCW9053016.1 hypothetical protein [Motiliproteus sp.]